MKQLSLTDELRTCWERETINLIIELCSVSNGDAQAIIEAQEHILNFCYSNGYAPIKTARIIDAASRT